MMEIVILVELVKAIVTLTIIAWDAHINSLLIINMVKRKKKSKVLATYSYSSTSIKQYIKLGWGPGPKT